MVLNNFMIWLGILTPYLIMNGVMQVVLLDELKYFRLQELDKMRF
jgi:hypothetical protein